MKTFKVDRSLPNGTYLVLGDFKDLPIGEKIEIEFEDKGRLTAVVETLVLGGGALVRVV